MTYSPDNVQKKGTFVLRSSNVKNGEIVDADNVYVSHDVVNSGNVLEGDVIVVVRNGSRDLIGKHAQIKQQMNNTVIGAFMTGVRSETPDFTNAMLDTQQFAIEINKNLGATINQITTGAFKKMHFVVPKDKDEREAIGTFFKQLDNTIAFHQRKLELLKQLKKAYLQQMFPTKDQLIPNIRFVNFKENWIQQKVKDLFKITRGQVLSVSKTSEIKTDSMVYPVYSSQTKNNGLLGFYDDYLFDSAITWTTDGANAGTVNYRKGKFYSTNVNGVLLSEEGYANNAIAESLNKIAWKYVSRVGNPKLMNNVMSDIVINVSNDIGELQKISNFLEGLDIIIIVNQERIEYINFIKKSYLKSLFL